MIHKVTFGACSAIGAGLGGFSCVFFLLLWLDIVPVTIFPWIACVCSLLIAGLAGYAALTVLRPAPAPKQSRIELFVFFPLLAYALWLIVPHILDHPHGDWDGWGIWNMHARFLLAANDSWRDLFSNYISWSHPDYPLMIPGMIAGLWHLAGSESPIIHQTVSFLFGIAALGILVSSVTLLSDSGRGFAAGIALLATPSFLWHLGYQMADLPLAFYFLMTLALLKLAEKFDSALLLGLGGISAGFAAWTKDEGLLFAMVVTTAFLSTGAGLDRKRTLRDALSFAAGLVPVLTLVLAFKMFLTPAVGMLTGLDVISAKVLDPGRYTAIVRAYVGQAFVFGDGRIPVIAVVVALAVYVRLRSRRTGYSLQRCTNMTLGLMAVGYAATYLITPYEVKWHLASSLSRLVLQLWPSILFAVGTSRLEFGPATHSASEQQYWWRNPLIGVATLVALMATFALVRGSLIRKDDQGGHQTTASGNFEVNGLLVTKLRSGPNLELAHASLTPPTGKSLQALLISDYIWNNILTGELVAYASSPQTEGVLPFHRTSEYRTGIAVYNAGTRPAAIRVEMNEGLERPLFEIPPNGHIVAYADEQPFLAGSDFGTIRLKSDVPVVIQNVLNYHGSKRNYTMTNMPVGDAGTLSASSLQIPYAVLGSAAAAELVLVNPTDKWLQGSVKWYGSSGVLLQTSRYSIKPRDSTLQMPPVLTDSQIARAALIPDSGFSPAGTLIFRMDRNEVLRLVSVPATAAVKSLKFFIECTNTIESELVIANAEVEDAIVRISLAGVQREIPVKPGAITILTTEQIRRLFNLPDGGRAALRVESNTPVAIAGLRYVVTDAGRRLVAAYSNPSSSGSFFPSFALGWGFETQFVMINSQAPVGISLSFFDRLGKLLPLPVEILP